MYSISQLARRGGLSRSTLLYYDKTGLLKPDGRSAAGYRIYSEENARRLAQICVYREAGLSLEQIKELLDKECGDPGGILQQRLHAINEEIHQLRQQQQQLIALIGKPQLAASVRAMSKSQWVNVLKGAGMDEAAMRRWHIEFERQLPEMHYDFLVSLGIDEEEIAKIRAWREV